MAPSDYVLFPKMKNHLAGKQYRTDEVISAVEDFFKDQMRELLYNRNPSAATPMEEVCGPHWKLC